MKKVKVIEITGHNDCPLWTADEHTGGKIRVCPEWYKIKGRRKWMRRPRKCPAKQGILIKVKPKHS